MSVLYSTNFDSLTPGTLPTGWVDLSGAPPGTGWQVVAFRPVSSPNAFSMGILVDNTIALYTGIAAMADMDLVYSWKVLHTTGSGATEQNISFILRSAADASAYYMFNPQWVDGTNPAGGVYLYRWDGATFHLVDNGAIGAFTAGDIVKVRAQCQGTTFRFKAWLASNTEPVSWDVTFTDGNITAAGYGGLRSGSGTSGSNVDPVVSIDNFSISDFTTPSRTQIALNDTNLFFSPYTWLSTGGVVRTTLSGAYFKLGFTGTSIEIDFGDAVANNTVKYTLDNAPYVSYTVPATGGQIAISGLDPGTHQIVLYATMCTQGADKWVTPVSIVAISAISVDNGSSSAPPANLSSKRRMFCGDSITEAVAGTGLNDATLGWAPILANAIGGEYGQRGYGGIGWIENNGDPSAVADVVPFFTPGDDSNSHWDKYDASHSLLVSGLFFPPPDDIFINFGTNDALAGASDASVQGSVNGALPALRTAAPNALIWVVIPFGGFKVSAITAGYNQYKSTSGDAKVYLIYLGTDQNLTGTVSFETPDGYHPNAITYAIKGASVANARQALITGGGGGGGLTPTDGPTLSSYSNDTPQVSTWKIANNTYLWAVANGWTGAQPGPTQTETILLRQIADLTDYLAGL